MNIKRRLQTFMQSPHSISSMTDMTLFIVVTIIIAYAAVGVFVVKSKYSKEIKELKHDNRSNIFFGFAYTVAFWPFVVNVKTTDA